MGIKFVVKAWSGLAIDVEVGVGLGKMADSIGTFLQPDPSEPPLPLDLSFPPRSMPGPRVILCFEPSSQPVIIPLSG